MREWGIWYRPMYGYMTKLFTTVKANSYEAAMMKFYSKHDDNCDEVLQVELLSKF